MIGLIFGIIVIATVLTGIALYLDLQTDEQIILLEQEYK